jgi:predicted Abi (CAAX) family protease
MKLLTSSILTLIALYVIYSEPFKLPTIVKKNKKLSYILIIGLYLYYHQNNVVEGVKIGSRDIPGFFIFLFICLALFVGAIVAAIVAAVNKNEKSSKWGFVIAFWVVIFLLYRNLSNS